MREATLALDLPAEHGLGRESRLEMPLRARETVVYALRSARLEAKREREAGGEWIEGDT